MIVSLPTVPFYAYAKKPLTADQIVSNYLKAKISVRQKHMLDFALKASRHAEQVNDAAYQKLNEQGFDNEDI